MPERNWWEWRTVADDRLQQLSAFDSAVGAVKAGEGEAQRFELGIQDAKAQQAAQEAQAKQETFWFNLTRAVQDRSGQPPPMTALQALNQRFSEQADQPPAPPPTLRQPPVGGVGGPAYGLIPTNQAAETDLARSLGGQPVDYFTDEDNRLAQGVANRDLLHFAAQQAGQAGTQAQHDIPVLGGIQQGVEAVVGRVVKPAAIAVIQLLDIPRNTLANVGADIIKQVQNRDLGDQPNFIERLGEVGTAAWKGMDLQERVSWRDNFQAMGLTTPWLLDAAGTVGDVVLDLSMWVTLGGKKALDAFRLGSGKGARLLTSPKYGVPIEEGIALNQAGVRRMQETIAEVAKETGLAESPAREIGREITRDNILLGEWGGLVERGGLKIRSFILGLNFEKTIIPGDVFEVLGGWVHNGIDRIPPLRELNKFRQGLFVNERWVEGSPAHSRLVYAYSQALDGDRQEIAKFVEDNIRKVIPMKSAREATASLFENLTQPEFLAAGRRQAESLAQAGRYEPAKRGAVPTSEIEAFHGTSVRDGETRIRREKMDVFYRDAKGQTQSRPVEVRYFTDDSATAGQYAALEGEAGRVIPVRLKDENILTYDAAGRTMAEVNPKIFSLPGIEKADGVRITNVVDTPNYTGDKTSTVYAMFNEGHIRPSTPVPVPTKTSEELFAELEAGTATAATKPAVGRAETDAFAALNPKEQEAIRSLYTRASGKFKASSTVDEVERRLLIARLRTEQGETVSWGTTLENARERIVNPRTRPMPTAAERDVSIGRLQESGLVDARQAQVIRTVSQTFEDLFSMEMREGILSSGWADYLPHVYKGDKTKIKDALNRLQGADPNQVFDINMPFAKERRVPTLEAAKATGLTPEEDIAKLVGIRLYASAKARRLNDLLSDVKDVFGVSAEQTTHALSVAPEGYVPMYKLTEAGDAAELMTRGELKGVYIPTEIADSLRVTLNRTQGSARSLETLKALTGGSDAAANAVWNTVKAYDYATRLFKGSVLRYPSFFARNARWNVAVSYLDSGLATIEPIRRINILQTMNGIGMEKVFSRMADGTPYTRQQLVDWASKTGALQPGAQGAIDFYEDLAPHMTRPNIFPSPDAPGKGEWFKALARTDVNLGRLIYDPENFVNRAARKFNSGIENFDRLNLFALKLDRTGEPWLAAEGVNRVLFDYQDLSWPEREILRRLIPFYTFHRKAVPLVAGLLVKEPGRFTVIPKVLSAISRGTTATPDNPQGYDPIYGQAGRRADPMGATQVFVQQQMGVYMGLDETGAPHFVGGLSFPPDELNYLWNGDARDTLEQLATQIHFIWRAPIEMMTNRSQFTGQAIDNPFISSYYEKLSATLADKLQHIPVISGLLDLKKHTVTDTVTGQPREWWTGEPGWVYALIDVAGAMIGLRRLDSEIRKVERLGDPATRIQQAVTLATGTTLVELGLAKGLNLNTSTETAAAFDAAQVRADQAIREFVTPDAVKAKLSDTFVAEGDTASLRKALKDIDQLRGADLGEAEATRVKLLSGPERLIEANRRELAKLFHAPGAQGAINAYRRVRLEDFQGNPGITSDEEWDKFFAARDQALKDVANAQTKNPMERVRLVGLYQEAAGQLKRDQIAKYENPQTRMIMMRRLEAEEKYQAALAMPRYVGIDPALGERYNAILSQIAQRARAMVPLPPMGGPAAPPGVPGTPNELQAYYNWVNEATGYGGDTKQARAEDAQAALYADRALKNPERSFALEDPDIQYWMTGTLYKTFPNFLEWRSQVNQDRFRYKQAWILRNRAAAASQQLQMPAA